MKLFIFPLLLALAGCASAVDAARSITDSLVARGGDVADKAMDAIDTAEGIAETEIVRLRAARCLNTLPAIRRYAERSPEKRAIIARDCGLIIEVDTARAVTIDAEGPE